MDAYAFALTLGTAGLAAMTVLGFHHGRAPGGSGHGHHHSTHVRGAGRAGGHAGGATGWRGDAGVSDEGARPPGTGSGRLNVSAAYSNGVISRQPGGVA